MKHHLKGILLTILSAVLFGLMPILAGPIYADGGNSFSLTFFRMAVGALSLGLICGAVGCKLTPPNKNQLKQLILCSLGYGGTPILLFASYTRLPSGISTAVHFVYPVLVLFACVLFLHQPLTGRSFLCCCLCTAGILCFYTPDRAVDLTGLLIAFLSGVTYAFYIVYLTHCQLQQEMPPLALAFWICLISAGLTGCVGLIGGQLMIHVSLPTWGLILLFGFLSSCVATVAFQVGASRIGPQSASLLSTFEPLTSIILGVCICHDTFTGRSLAGVCFILLSVVLLALGQRRARSSPA